MSEMGTETALDKIENVRKKLINADELKSSLAFLGYCRRFVKTFSSIISPLTNLLTRYVTMEELMVVDTKV